MATRSGGITRIAISAAARRRGSMTFNRSFWRGRRVFLTGHTGFKGSWLSLWLHQLGADVTGYALDPPTQPNLFEQAGVGGTIRSIHADVCDIPRLNRSISECLPEVDSGTRSSVMRRFSGTDAKIVLLGPSVSGRNVTNSMKSRTRATYGGQRVAARVRRF